MGLNVTNESVTAVPESNGADGAVGVPGGQPCHWFVAMVSHNAERSSAERLNALGIETYVASQPEWRVRKDGRRRLIDRIVISCMIFVHCTEQQRLDIARQPYIHRFLLNRAGTLNAYGRPVAIVNDAEINTLRFMLGQSDTPVSFDTSACRVGDRVRVIRGSLRGLEGTLITDPASLPTDSTLAVRLDLLGCATLTIPSADLLPVT